MKDFYINLHFKNHLKLKYIKKIKYVNHIFTQNFDILIQTSVFFQIFYLKIILKKFLFLFNNLYDSIIVKNNFCFL